MPVEHVVLARPVLPRGAAAPLDPLALVGHGRRDGRASPSRASPPSGTVAVDSAVTTGDTDRLGGCRRPAERCRVVVESAAGAASVSAARL